MRVQHNLVLLACEVSKLPAPRDTRIAVLINGGREETQPAVDERLRVLARRTEVDELDLARTCVPEEVRPVGVRLH